MAVYTGPTGTADYYRGLIGGTAQQYGVDPAQAIRLATFESGLNPGAVSPAGAIGLFQLMPSTAQQLGVNPWNPVQNIWGGVQYWAQALAAAGGNPILAYSRFYNPGYQGPGPFGAGVGSGAVTGASVGGGTAPSAGWLGGTTPVVNFGSLGAITVGNKQIMQAILILIGLILIVVGVAAFASSQAGRASPVRLVAGKGA